MFVSIDAPELTEPVSAWEDFLKALEESVSDEEDPILQSEIANARETIEFLKKLPAMPAES